MVPCKGLWESRLDRRVELLGMHPRWLVVGLGQRAQRKDRMRSRVNHGGVQNAIRKITPSYLALYNP